MRAVRARASPVTERIASGADPAENAKAADHEDVTDADHDPAPHVLNCTTARSNLVRVNLVRGLNQVLEFQLMILVQKPNQDR